MKKSRKKVEVVNTDVLDLGYADRTKLMTFPWPWKDNSIKEVKITDVIAFVPAMSRPTFMDELYRIMTDDATATIISVYYSTLGAVSDFRVEWPPISESSFLYFNAEWRKMNQVEHPMKCDFDFTYGYTLTPEIAARHADVQAQAVKSDLNTVQRLHVVLKKRLSK